MPPLSAVFSPQSSVLRQSSPGTPNRRPTSIRMETEDQRKSRLAGQEQVDRLKAEAAVKEKKEKEKAEAERKAKVAGKVHRLDEQKEQRWKQGERLRKEAEAQERQRLKKEEEQRLKLKQEEERILKAKQEEKALRLVQERERAKAKAEAISDLEPEEREEAKLEAHKGDGKQDGQLEDGRDVDTETMEDGKDKPEDSLRINTISIHSPTSDKRRPGPRVLTSAIRSVSPVVTTLATARVITDIASVSYPEGYHGPHPDLNRNVKNGKFRYH